MTRAACRAAHARRLSCKSSSALRGSRRAQAHRRGVRARVAPPMHQEVRTFAPPRPGCSRWPTGSRARLHARGDGGHGRVLEAGLARARRRLRAGAGQRRAHPQRARAQDRRKRRDVDRRPAGARADPRQLRAAAGVQELRDLTRTRKQLVREIAQHTQRIQKVLEDANLKLGSVLSDVLGKSGARCSMRSSPARPTRSSLAALAQGTARTRPPTARGAARTRHRAPPLMLKLHLQVVDALSARSPSGHRGGRSAGAVPAARPPLDDDAGGQ